MFTHTLVSLLAFVAPEAEAPPTQPTDTVPVQEPTPTTNTTSTGLEDPFVTSPPEAGAPPEAAPPAQPPAKKRNPATKRGQFSFYWDLNQTVGSSHQWAQDFSALGFSAAFTYRVIPLVSVGGLGGYTYTDDKVRTTRETDNAAVTATEVRTLESVPLMVTGIVHIPTSRSSGPRGRGWVEPYVGVGIGTYYTYRRADLGWVLSDENGWHFGLMPMLGIQVDTPGVQVLLGSRFNWAAVTEKAARELFFTFNIGLGFFAF
jgi:hypothetical protein